MKKGRRAVEKDEQEVLRTWIEIDKKALVANVRTFRKLLGKHIRLLGVVKSNAYGHGLMDTGPALVDSGVDMLGVDSLVEAFTLRREGVKTPLLVLGYTLPALLSRARKEGIAVTLSSIEQIHTLRSLPKGKPLLVHVKVDTGMHRQGFQLYEHSEIIPLLRELKEKGSIEVAGLYTHFAKAKDPRDKDMTNRQIHEFEEWRKVFVGEGFTPTVHMGATGASLVFPRSHSDMVRIGIGFYGLWPSRETEHYFGKKLTLRPVLSWRALVSEVKTVKKGERVGYDATELLARDTRIAIIPVGYWQGFSRSLSSRARVLIRGGAARVLGRVSMNMIVVDVTDIEGVMSGDVATLIGKDGKEEISAGELAQLSGTTSYEVLARLNPLMKRFVV